MRPTIGQLRTWNPDTITGAGESAQRAAQLLDGARHEFASGQRWPFFWFGRTHDAARRCVTQEADHADEVRNVLQQITDEAKDAGTDLGHARQVVLRAVDEAGTAGFAVSDAGTVSHAEATRAGDATSLQGRIQRGLDVIDDIDERYGARLDDLRGDLAAMLLGQPDVTVPGIGTLDPDAMITRLEHLTVEQRRALLAGTSPTDVRRLIQADPARMGTLDGVPFEQRGIANEINIRNALATEVRTHGPTTQRAQMLRSFLGQRTAPASGATHPTTNHPDALSIPEGVDTERVYISFTDGENPRLIEMVGSLTTGTPNATVYVPGTGTNARGYGGSNWNAAWNLAEQTGGPVFVYLDGELPQTLVDTQAARRMGIHALLGRSGWPMLPFDAADLASDGAADPRYAREMAPRLVDFGRALDAEIAAVAPGATTSYVGHSYGGSIVGSAEQLGLRADNIIFASSAGTGVFDAPPTLPNPSGGHYSLTAPGDPIHAIQSLPGNPHGDDPDSAPGVTRLDTGTYGDGTLVAGPRGHGGYWDDPRSGAFQAMVGVITGADPPEYVARAPDHPVTHYGAPVARDLTRAVGVAATGLATVLAHDLAPDPIPTPDIGGLGRALDAFPLVAQPGSGLDTPLRLW